MFPPKKDKFETSQGDNYSAHDFSRGKNGKKACQKPIHRFL